MKQFILSLLIMVCCLNAQKLVSSYEESGNCINSASAYDVESLSQFHNSYIATHKGCSASVIDFTQKIELSSLDIVKLGIDTTSSQSYPFEISFYKNFFANDGSWTAVITRYMSSTWVVHGGQKTKLSTERCLTNEIRVDGNNLYLIVKGWNVKDVYIVRNNLTISALPKLEFPKREHHASKGLNLWSDVNPLGQKMTDGTLSRNLKLLR